MVKTNKKEGGGLGETIRTVVYAVGIALVIRTFAFEPFNIPSGSMIPTLLVGDYLFVSKYSYGYSKHSMPFSLPLVSGRIAFTPPERGDVMVFKLPKDTAVDYIKRVIGLPGDRIQMIQGRLYINGKIVERKKDEDYVFRNEGGDVVRVTRYIEILPNGRSHPIIERSDEEFKDNTEIFQVPAGHYFMMGDNRDNSQDSRYPSVGFVPMENLVGRAEILWWSTDGTARWWEPWKWPFGIRFSRMFTAIR